MHLQANDRCSRNAATVHSQGREPLVRFAEGARSPEGGDSGHFRPVGAWRPNTLRIQGLAPLAIDLRPFGPGVQIHKLQRAAPLTANLAKSQTMTVVSW
jgi:hypothetical protein